MTTRATLTPKQVSAIIQRIYHTYTGLPRLVARLRPYICPFGEIIDRIPSTETMLDVGCGLGYIGALAVTQGIVREAHGIDVSPGIIAAARRHTHIDNGAISFDVFPPGRWPNERYDCVVAVDVLHHVDPPDQQDFINHMCQATKDDGMLILKDISPSPRWKANANSLHDLAMSRQVVSYRPENQVEDWISGNQMDIGDHSRLDRLWYSHYVITAHKNA